MRPVVPTQPQVPVPGGRTAKPWLAALARVGMAAAGVVWIIVGFLAVQLAAGSAGEAASEEGALHSIAEQSWGAAALVAIAVGLGAYALWSLVLAALGQKLERGERVDAGERVIHLLRGLFYGLVCYTAVSILTGPAGSAGGGEQESTAEVLGWPGGPWIVGAIGLAVIGGGGYHAYRALSGAFEDDLRTGEMSARTERWVRRAGVVAFIGRAIVFALVGIFLVRAAVQYDPQEAVGLDGALQRVADESYGTLLIGVCAAGLVAYGVFCFVRARYREV